MNLNIASQHQGLIAWSALAGPVNPGIDIRQHNGFSFTFNVDSDITADAVFEVRSAPPLPTDNCMGDVANASDIPEVMMCAMPGQIAAPKSQIIFPVGTKAGTVCTATIPCRPDAFVKVFAVSGDTGRITVIAVLSGPR
jgi:hypothetical protein